MRNQPQYKPLLFTGNIKKDEDIHNHRARYINSGTRLEDLDEPLDDKEDK